MSTKTITKRVALATVVALGAGVLSLVSVSSANASTLGQNSLPGNAGHTATNGYLNIGTTTNNTASAVIITSGPTVASVGLVAVSDITGSTTPSAGTTQTATLVTGGSLAVYTASESNYSGGTIVVTGGTISATTGSTGISADRTAMSYGANVALNAVAISPNTGVTTMYVRAYKAGTAGTAGDVTAPTSGTLFGQITVSVVPAGTNGTLSVAKSGIYYKKNGTSATGTTTSSDDTTSTMDANTNYLSGASSLPWNVTNFAIIDANDAYGVGLTSTTGLLTATATNGAYVGLAGETSVASTSSQQTTAFLTGKRPDGATLAVSAPSAAPVTTTVTIAYNGVTLGTKTFVFTGPISKVTIAAPSHINKNSHSAAANFKGAAITYADAAGNAILPISGDSAYPSSGFGVAATSARGTVIQSILGTSTATGYIDWTCGTSASTDSAIVQYTNVDGTVATSNAVNVSCAGAATTYTASYDKSTYNPGDIATLTVTFKDSKGNLAADYSTDVVTGNYYFANYVATSSPLVGVSGGTLAASPAVTTLPSMGLATFQVLTGVTEGTYQTTVNLGSTATAGVTSVTQTAPSIAGFTLKAQSTGTSLNDVLKGIVSLIASINKQIAALAKLVAKK